MSALVALDKEVDAAQDPRQGISKAKQYAAHALAKAAGLYNERFGERDKAIVHLDLAVKSNPNDPALYSKLCDLLVQEERYDEALEISTKGLKLRNPPFHLYHHHGNALRLLKRLREAADAYKKAVELNPESASSHWFWGRTELRLGNFEIGFRETEWRFKALPPAKDLRSRYKQSTWDGNVAEVRGKRILVFNDQGFGDSINFLRYVRDLKEAGAYVIFECYPELFNLYKQCNFIDDLVKREPTRQEPIVPPPTIPLGERIKTKSHADPIKLPDHDYIISICTLPLFFDPHLTKPAVGSYIKPSPSNNEELAKGLNIIKSHGDKLKVGIFWAGNPHHDNDKHRSCWLKYFQPVADLPNVQLFSLQRGDMRRSWPANKASFWLGDDLIVVDLMEGHHIPYIDMKPYIADWNDTAITLTHLDLLLTVDTAIGHLAGALGVPVWVLLPLEPEWRWARDWYPSLRQFRQVTLDGWEELLQRVAREINFLKILDGR